MDWKGKRTNGTGEYQGDSEKPQALIYTLYDSVFFCIERHLTSLFKSGEIILIIGRETTDRAIGICTKRI